MVNRRLGILGACVLSLFAVTHCGDSGGSDSGSGGASGSGNQAGLHASGGKSSGAGGTVSSSGASGAPLTPGGSDGSGGAPAELGGGASGTGLGASGAGLGGAPGVAMAGAPAGGAGGDGPPCILSSPPAAGNVYDGDLALDSAADVDAARVYSRITGCLTLDVAAGEVLLPNLLSLGSLHAQSSSITRLSLPNVRSIDGELWIYLNGKLAELDLRHLEEVAGRLYIHRNIALTDLQLISLRSVQGSTTKLDGDSEITGNINLPACLLDIPKARFQSFAFTSAVPNCSCSAECDHVSVDGC